MGTSKQLVISATGFPGTNKMLRFMQTAYSETLGALAKFIDTKTIINGVTLSGGSYTAGWVVYDGEILQFEAGAPQANVTIVEGIENAEYDYDGNNDGIKDILPAYKSRYMKFGSDGVVTFPFADLKRLRTIKELQAWQDGFTLPGEVFTTALLNKLNGIEVAAEVNVQADWNETAPTADGYINNKPFQSIRVTSGSGVCNTLLEGQQQNNSAANRYTVYPPSGYTIGDLAGFIPSISQIFFNGNVDNGDTLWCNYEVDTAGNRVIIYANNSEHRAAPRVHYFAIWIKY